ncbi:MAG: LytTR family DNA-binding domain-containing protein [Bacteroidota bacterium]
MKYKVLIVDDEEPARDLLKVYAGKLEELEVEAIVSNALDAKKVIETGSVDILLSDIQMDDLTGIDLVKTLKNPPVTIFTTAYSEYALEGFDLDIIDYMVKPISFQRFCKAIDKATELIRFRKEDEGTIPQSMSTVEGAQHKTDFFFVKTNRKLVKVAYADILFVESYGEYVKIYTSDDVILALQTTAFMEQHLPSSEFIRIHRSHIINLGHVSEISGNEVTIDRHRLVISKRQKDQFMKMVRQKGII